MTLATTKTLYEEDFALWIETTVQSLKAGDLSQVDLENLIEEVESLGRKERSELKSRLITLFEHALKRVYVDLPDCYRGWAVTLVRTQEELADILQDSPSLNPYFVEVIDGCYQSALRIVRAEYQTDFPQDYPFPSEMNVLLNEEFWLNHQTK
jgi:hypothetical protein